MTDQWWSSARQPPGAVPYRNKFDAARDPLSARVALGAAALDSPVFVGDPQAPTPPAGDNDQSIATTEWVTAAAGVTVHNHCGRLEYVSATALKFAPYNGDRIKINGSIFAIPLGGITLTNSGLSASTLYYVYVYDNAGTVTGEFSATGHATSTTAGNVGTEIKSGDDTRTLIGMVMTDASQFWNDRNWRGVISWFNRRNIALEGVSTGGAATTSTSFVELTTAARVYFLIWSDEAVHVTVTGQATVNVAAGQVNTTIILDGSGGLLPATVGGNVPGVNYYVTHSGSQSFATTESLHYITPAGVVGSGTGSFSVALSGVIRG